MAKVQVTVKDHKRQYNRRNTSTTKVAKPTIAKLDKPSKLEELDCMQFSIDPRVQRELNEQRVGVMSEDFKPHALGLITASRRVDGHIYVLDGAHRVSAARRAKYDGLLATRVFENLTLAEEAGLFLTTNSTRAVQPIDKFKVRVTMGDPAAVNINHVLKHYGLQVNWAGNGAINAVSAVGTLEKVYYGAGVRPQGEYSDLVDRVIGSIHRAYGPNGERANYSRTMLEGLGIFWATFNKRIDPERLTQILQGTVPRQIAAQARTRRDANGGTIGENSAEVIHRLYNHRFRGGKLPDFHEVDISATYFVPDSNPHAVDPSRFALYSDEEVAARNKELENAGSNG